MKPTKRRSRWLWIVFVALLVVPITEIAVIIAVGKVIGGWPTLILLLLESALGAWLIKREGKKAWLALTTALRTGRLPSRELSDAALVLVGDALLLTPGFLTDAVGFFFVLPMTRPLAARFLEMAVRRRLLQGWGVGPVGYQSGTPHPTSHSPGAAPNDAAHTRQQHPPGDGDVIRGEVV